VSVADVVEYLAGERAEPIDPHFLAADLERQSKKNPTMWPNLDHAGWMRAIRAAIATGEIIEVKGGVRLPPPKDKPTADVPKQMNLFD
jgi:hypothetical protein